MEQVKTEKREKYEFDFEEDEELKGSWLVWKCPGETVVEFLTKKTCSTWSWTVGRCLRNTGKVCRG